MDTRSSIWLRHVRNVAFVCSLAALVALVGLTIWSQSHFSPDAIIGITIAVMVASGIVFTVATYLLAFRKIRSQAATNDRSLARTGRSRGLNPVAIGIGLAAVAANVVAIVITGNSGLLDVLLGFVILLFLVLLQRYARGG